MRSSDLRKQVYKMSKQITKYSQWKALKAGTVVRWDSDIDHHFTVGVLVHKDNGGMSLTVLRTSKPEYLDGRHYSDFHPTTDGWTICETENVKKILENYEV